MTNTGTPDIYVDLALLAEAVADLKAVWKDAEHEADRWRNDRIEQRIGRVGTDPVSIQLRRNMVTMAERQGQWLVEYAAQLKLAYEALQAQHDSYLHLDEDLAAGMAAL